MNIGIIGTGNVAKALGRAWADKGHQIFFGSRTPEKAAEAAKATDANARGGSVAEAARFGEVILFAVTWAAAGGSMQAVSAALKQMGPLDEKILIDCTNPLTADKTGLALGHTTSAAEEIAKLAPGAKIVKAFNHIFADVMRRGLALADKKITAFYCGDDSAAKAAVAALIADAGFDPIDFGPLRNARFLEPLAQIIIQLGYRRGKGTNIALKLLDDL